jgi:hypothetical protein
MKVIWLILIILICPGCTNNRKIQQTGLENNLISYSDTMEQNDYHTIFNESMKRAINEFIIYIKDKKYTSSIEEKVLSFYFYSEAGKDYFLMIAEPYYERKLIKGYTYIGNYVFVYYGEEGIGNQYINASKLISYHDTLPGFRAYDEVPIGIYEPFGTLFQIINPDSLILIQKGML